MASMVLPSVVYNAYLKYSNIMVFRIAWNVKFLLFVFKKLHEWNIIDLW